MFCPILYETYANFAKSDKMSAVSAKKAILFNYLCTLNEENNAQLMKLALTYLAILAITLMMLVFVPAHDGNAVDSWPVIVSLASLFVLFVGLSARLIGWHDKPEGLVMTALFLIVFLPAADPFYQRDTETIVGLGSQCIVPFFIGQYNRIRFLPFSRWYTLMLLMGIFCSYTHDGITIPLCASFVWLAFRHRDHFFRTACWPMVIGFVIGTSLSIWKNMAAGPDPEENYLNALSTHTTQALGLLWDTKIFIPAIGLSAYLSVSRWGRRLIRKVFVEHTLLGYCALFSFCSLPFAPLGLDNAVQGVCFFCMFWTLILGKQLIYKLHAIRQPTRDVP